MNDPKSVFTKIVEVPGISSYDEYTQFGYDTDVIAKLVAEIQDIARQQSGEFCGPDSGKRTYITCVLNGERYRDRHIYRFLGRLDDNQRARRQHWGAGVVTRISTEGMHDKSRLLDVQMLNAAKTEWKGTHFVLRVVCADPDSLRGIGGDYLFVIDYATKTISDGAKERAEALYGDLLVPAFESGCTKIYLFRETSLQAHIDRAAPIDDRLAKGIKAYPDIPRLGLLEKMEAATAERSQPAE